MDCLKFSAAWDRLWLGRTACSSLGKLVYLMVSFTLINEGESLVHTAAQLVHAADG
jgi:predicted metal-binding protein